MKQPSSEWQEVTVKLDSVTKLLAQTNNTLATAQARLTKPVKQVPHNA